MMLTLEGRIALSRFRIIKLLSELRSMGVKDMEARYLHFLDVDNLTSDDDEVVRKLLSYGARILPRPAS